MPKRSPQIDIWGSCVSRDTVEHMPDVAVGEYIARQSAIVALGPSDGLDIPLDLLDSDFQRRMITGDQKGDAAKRLTATVPAIVLVDLIDERHGVWRFPGNRFLTNSVEAYKTGIDTWGPQKGGRLIDFGTNEHFELWKQGFDIVLQCVRGNRAPVVFLDIAWAEVFDGQPLPRGARSLVGSAGRRVKRGAREMLRSVARGRSLSSSLEKLMSPEATRAERLSTSARRANKKSNRYAQYAVTKSDAIITRTADAVRMNPAHRWGIGPYHYRDADYHSIGTDIRPLLKGQPRDGE